jgi:putative PIN family toxin of toxin-antitoxin system
VQLVFDAKVNLFISHTVLRELRDVTSRPGVIRKLGLVPDGVEMFLTAVETVATLLDGFPEVFNYERDPDDAHYVNLALAADARLIVSRDKDLLDLMVSADADAVQFRTRFPDLRITDPAAFLAEVSIT